MATSPISAITRFAAQANLSRVQVLGTSCSGKSTFARRLAAAQGGTCIELDALNWLPGWQVRPHEELRELTQEAVTADRWVIDGNYNSLREITWPRATALIWLNYSFPLTFSRALRRTMRRAWTREELFAGNRESFRLSFFSRDSILLWVANSYRTYRRGYRKVFDANGDSNSYPHLARLELRTPRLAEQFLQEVESVYSG